MDKLTNMNMIILLILLTFLNISSSRILNTNNFYKKFNVNSKLLNNGDSAAINFKFKILLNPFENLNENNNNNNELIFDKYELVLVKNLSNENDVILNNLNEIEQYLKINLIYRTKYEFNYELNLSIGNNRYLLNKSYKIRFHFLKSLISRSQQKYSLKDEYNNEDNGEGYSYYYYTIDILNDNSIDKIDLLPSIQNDNKAQSDDINDSANEIIYYYYESYLDSNAYSGRFLLSSPMVGTSTNDDLQSVLMIDLNKLKSLLALNSLLLNANYNGNLGSSLIVNDTIDDYTIGCIDYDDSYDDIQLNDDSSICRLNIFNLLIINTNTDLLKMQLNRNLNDLNFHSNSLNLVLYMRKNSNLYNKLEVPNILYINIRINLVGKKEPFDNLLSYINDKEQQKHYNKKRQALTNVDSAEELNTFVETNSGANGNGAQSNIMHKSQNYYNNILTPLQLVINEETIGLQTKIKLYEHVWFDYQLNASDYVKERIQLLSPDNSMLNITKRFDYEYGGPIHHFQIIFIRKVDKRISK